MTESKTNIITVSLSIFLFLSSYFLFKYLDGESKYNLDIEKIEKTIKKQDAELTKTIIRYQNILKKNKKLLANKKSPEFFKTLPLSENKKITILIYENDTLKYWNNNDFPAPFYFEKTELRQKKVINASNGWYRLKTKTLENFTVAGLYKIKNNFFYENKYLQNKFSAGLNLPSSTVVSTSPISIGKNIKDENGNYLFSLIPSNNIVDKDKNTYFPFILFLISFALFLSFMSKQIQKFKSEKPYISALLGLSTVITYVIILKTKYFYQSNIFYSETIYKGNFPFDNTANISLTSIFLTFIVITALKIFNGVKPQTTKQKFRIYATTFISISAFLLFQHLISNLFKDLILNSSINFDIKKIITPDIIFITTFFSISLLYISTFLFADFIIKNSLKKIPPQKLFLLILTAGILFSALFYGKIIEIIFYETFIILIFIIRKFQKKHTYLSLISIIFVFSLFSLTFTNKYLNIKEKTKKKELIKKLTDDNDPVAESFLREINKRIYKDTTLINKITNVSENQDLDIFDYLKRKYFYGYWEKYDLEISLCGNTEFYPKENQAENCNGFYRNEIKEFGEKIKNADFWQMHYNTGKITYFGIINVPETKDIRQMSLYITLSEKLTQKILGYPALLIDKSTKTKDEFSGYSYAKYSNDTLVVKFGNFPYELTEKNFKKKQNKPEYETDYNNYSHLVYKGNKNKTIVISKKKPVFFDYVTTFVYLFFIYNLIIILSILSYDKKFLIKGFTPNFKNKIRFSMIFLLLISFLIFGAGTVYFIIKQNNTSGEREMREKIQSVLTELNHKLQYENELTPDWHNEQYDHLDELLNKFSQVFFSDINLYDPEGKLLATSRSEIFNKGLIGKQTDPVAFKKITVEGKTEYIQKESIGNMEFLSIYIPFRNEKNKITAIINLPYFSDNNTIKKNITDILLATVNLYLVLFLITASLSVLLSAQITKPLSLLQNKLKEVQIGKKHGRIKYNKKDEIGTLVEEYNSMLKKLEESAKKLAESERESAWREMAKQIAHEIKNPLTPMKLSIQLLQRTWNDKEKTEKEFEQRLSAVSQTLTEQIDTLSSIASEFSAFAKMPKARKEEVEIVKKLKNIASLFENEQNSEIKLILNKIKKLYVIADKEQISRVFINLIKNAVQAIPQNRKGLIKIILQDGENKAVITIEDNGTGIDDEQKKLLFEPNFTTKTTGTGIGLAIVKNIVTSAGGNIKVESKKGKGTKFIVEFLKVQTTFT